MLAIDLLAILFMTFRLGLASGKKAASSLELANIGASDRIGDTTVLHMHYLLFVTHRARC